MARRIANRRVLVLRFILSTPSVCWFYLMQSANVQMSVWRGWQLGGGEGFRSARVVLCVCGRLEGSDATHKSEPWEQALAVAPPLVGYQLQPLDPEVTTASTHAMEVLKKCGHDGRRLNHTSDCRPPASHGSLSLWIMLICWGANGFGQGSSAAAVGCDLCLLLSNQTSVSPAALSSSSSSSCSTCCSPLPHRTSRCLPPPKNTGCRDAAQFYINPWALSGSRRKGHLTSPSQEHDARF